MASIGVTSASASVERLRLAVGTTPVWSRLREVDPGAGKLDELLTSVRRLNEGIPSGWPVGLEQKLLRRNLPLLQVDPATIRSPLVANLRYLHIVQEEPDRQRGRPPSELAAQHMWDRLTAAPLTQDDLLEAARLLGGEARFRKGEMYTSRFASGHYKVFVPRAQVEPRLDRLLHRLNTVTPRLHPLLHATGIFFETTLIHPLSDGNGRLARLLFQVALRQTIGLKAPILPLGPACAANRVALTAAFLAWEFDRNAQPLVAFVTAALAQLAALYDKGAKPAHPAAG